MINFRTQEIMSKIFLGCFVFLILFQLIVGVKSQNTYLEPLKRATHTATLIDNKLYILGGFKTASGTDEQSGQQFFYLDVSKPFTTRELKWVDLTSINLVPSHRRAGSVKGGANNDTLFLYGGDPVTREMAIVYTFDTQSLSWSTPEITGDYQPLNKSSLLPVTGNNGKMYLFGGFLFKIGDASNYANDMAILDTVNLRWEQGSTTNVPTARGFYGAVLLPNQKIIYIGGSAGPGVPYSLAEVYLYDTINDEWATQSTTGNVPSDRAAFSAVLGLDGQRVIIYGGHVTTLESLYVLDVNSWEWYVPKVYGDYPQVTPFSHKANVIGRYMVVTFGNTDNIQARGLVNDVSLLDISNNDGYRWTNIFNPTKESKPSDNTVNTDTGNTNAPKANIVFLVGVISGSVVGCILLSVGGFLLYKRRKNHEKYRKAIPTPGEVDHRKSKVIPTPGEANSSATSKQKNVSYF